MTRILVTGGAGFIGAHLAKRLLSDGFEVVIVDDLSTGRKANLPRQAEFIEADAGSASFLDNMPPGPYAAICHMAGQSSGEASFDDPSHDLDANGRSTALLARWAALNGVPRFLHASSMSVYGSTDGTPVAEEAAPKPISYYGASKLYGEHALRVADERIRPLSFRMFNVYGPGQNLDNMRQGMVSIYLAYLVSGQPVLVKGSLDRVRDFVHVDDVVSAWMLALRSDATGVVNLGTGTGTSVRELIRLLIEVSGQPPEYPVQQSTGTPGDQFRMVANPRLAKDLLGWEAQTSLRDGLKEMVAWAQGRSRHVAR